MGLLRMEEVMGKGRVRGMQPEMYGAMENE